MNSKAEGWSWSSLPPPPQPILLPMFLSLKLLPASHPGEGYFWRSCYGAKSSSEVRDKLPSPAHPYFPLNCTPASIFYGFGNQSDFECASLLPSHLAWTTFLCVPDIFTTDIGRKSLFLHTWRKVLTFLDSHFIRQYASIALHVGLVNAPRPFPVLVLGTAL